MVQRLLGGRVLLRSQLVQHAFQLHADGLPLLVFHNLLLEGRAVGHLCLFWGTYWVIADTTCLFFWCALFTVAGRNVRALFTVAGTYVTPFCTGPV